MDPTTLSQRAAELAGDARTLSENLGVFSAQLGQIAARPEADGGDPFVFHLTVFALACFVGYYVVWRVTPALHSPLMAVTVPTGAPLVTTICIPTACACTAGNAAGEAPESAKIRIVTKIAAPAAKASRCVTATRSPRFQARNGPNGSTISSGAMIAPNVSEKNGAPTEMVRPVSASRING